MQSKSSFSTNINISSNNKQNKSNGEFVPQGIEELIKDEDENGIPDFADKLIKDAKIDSTHKSTNVQININGKNFDNIDDALFYAKENFPGKDLLKGFDFFGQNKGVVIKGDVPKSQSAISNNNFQPQVDNLKVNNYFNLFLGVAIVSLIIVSVIAYFMFK